MEEISKAIDVILVFGSCCMARLCHSRGGGNPVKHIKNKFFMCLFCQICKFCINIEVIFLDPRFRGDDIE